MARVISNEMVLGELVRRAGARSILGTWIMWLDCPEIAAVAKPGQYLMVCCGEFVLPRPFSIHRADKGRIAILYAVWVDGKGTQWLSRRRVGEELKIFGPLGNSFSVRQDSRRLLLVAGGIGIAPLCFLAQWAQGTGRNAILLQGASGEFRSKTERNPSQLLPRELLPCSIDCRLIESDEFGLKGMVTDLLPDYTSSADQIFACGPLAMYRTMAEMPELKGKPVQVSLEVGMGCGVGVCYGCTIRTASGLKQVCKEGPVFELKDIVWDSFSFGNQAQP